MAKGQKSRCLALQRADRMANWTWTQIKLDLDTLFACNQARIHQSMLFKSESDKNTIKSAFGGPFSIDKNGSNH